MAKKYTSNSKAAFEAPKQKVFIERGMRNCVHYNLQRELS
jgi:hypothetical protein